jgi:hypothetical protein
MASRPLLFTHTKLRGAKVKNRVVISPMYNFPATEGHINELHVVDMGKFESWPVRYGRRLNNGHRAMGATDKAAAA